MFLGIALAACNPASESVSAGSVPTTSEADTSRLDVGDEFTETSAMPARSAPTTVPMATISSIGPSDDSDTQVIFEGTTYECDSSGVARWECERPRSTVYCDGAIEPSECSEVWYPNELQGIRLVTFEGIDYACESYGLACVSYGGGEPPPALWNPEVWCDGLECTYYDPDVWFEVSFDFFDYFCTDALMGFEQYDCYQSFSDSPPQVTLDPDVYCSGSEYSLSCDERWYPDELRSLEIVTFNGADYLCESSYVGSYGDYDCGAYWGGDPGLVYTGELKCTNHGTSFDCAYETTPPSSTTCRSSTSVEPTTYARIPGVDPSAIATTGEVQRRRCLAYRTSTATSKGSAMNGTTRKTSTPRLGLQAQMNRCHNRTPCHSRTE